MPFRACVCQRTCSGCHAQDVCQHAWRLHAGQAPCAKRCVEDEEALLRPRFRRRCPAAEPPAPPPGRLQLTVLRATWAALLSAVLAELRPRAAADGAAAAGEDPGVAAGAHAHVPASARVAVSLPPLSQETTRLLDDPEAAAPAAERSTPPPAPAAAADAAVAGEGPADASAGDAPNRPDAPMREAASEAAGQLTAEAPAADGLAHPLCSREGSPVPAGSAMQDVPRMLSGEPGGGGPEADAPDAPGEAPAANLDVAPAPVRASKRIRCDTRVQWGRGVD